MAPRELIGVALSIVGVVLAPVAIILGGRWWLAVIAVLLVGLVLYLSQRVVERHQRYGHQLDDMARGHGLGLGPHRPARVSPRGAREGSDASEGDASDTDGD